MIACPHRPPCPGCPRLELPGIDARARDGLESLARRYGASPPRFAEGRPLAFRHRARLAVRGRVASPKIGIFELGSHRLIDIPRCLVHHPLVNAVAGELRRAIVASHATPYSDAAHEGLVRYVQIAVERASTSAQVVVVANSDDSSSCTPLFAELGARLGSRLHSLFWNGNTARTNTILGGSFERIAGPEAIVEHIGGARVFYPPGAFGQNHLDLADAIVRDVHAWVPDGTSVVEFYAGVGPIGLGLVPRSRTVVFNEIAPESLRGLSMGIDALGATDRARTRIVAGPAGAAGALLTDADVAIVDPPRKGLDPALREAIVRVAPGRLIYVACGLVSFMADTEAILSSGKWALRSVHAYDLFPHTEHVEVAALFES